jgi:2-methylcitrate dehydratase PrpD
MAEKDIEFTKVLGRFIVDTGDKDIPSEIYRHAGVAFMDWLGCAVGGKDEPGVEKLIALAELMGGKGQASIIGHNIKTSLSQAALINGTESHVLDYDDSSMAVIGHPSVTIFPGLLALSEYEVKGGKDFLTAYIIAFKVMSTIGRSTSMEHYMAGWHATSTVGHLASASACSKILNLDEQQTVHALGIAGTQACGLKRSFGTMCKSFHAGRAAQVGLMSALLAREGFTGAEDILEGNDGFLKAFSGKINEEAVDSLGKTWDIENLLQKYHASCHGTHSAIEAVSGIVQEQRLEPDKIKSIKISVSPMALTAAWVKEPKTGLEGKFCIPYTVANAVLTGDTGEKAFTRVNEKVMEFMNRISVEGTDERPGMEAYAELETESGNRYSKVKDVTREIPSLVEKEDKIRAKFSGLCEPALGEGRVEQLTSKLTSLEEVDNIKEVIELLQP